MHIFIRSILACESNLHSMIITELGTVTERQVADLLLDAMEKAQELLNPASNDNSEDKEHHCPECQCTSKGTACNVPSCPEAPPKLDPNVSLVGTKWCYTGNSRVLTVEKHDGESIELGDKWSTDCISLEWLQFAYTQLP